MIIKIRIECETKKKDVRRHSAEDVWREGAHLRLSVHVKDDERFPEEEAVKKVSAAVQELLDKEVLLESFRR